jgi:hypothetical protein
MLTGDATNTIFIVFLARTHEASTPNHYITNAGDILEIYNQI